MKLSALITRLQAAQRTYRGDPECFVNGTAGAFYPEPLDEQHIKIDLAQHMLDDDIPDDVSPDDIVIKIGEW